MSPAKRATRKGKATQANILETAVGIASVEGLNGLTIGQLAKDLEMSKSGLFGHFGSKEDLQLATVAAAREIFTAAVITPGRAVAPGLPRLWALCNGWLDYLDAEVFPGGCFYLAASAEFDSRPGPVRDAVAADMREWLGYLERGVRKAQELGQIRPEEDPAQLVFEINAIFGGANWQLQLYDDPQAIDRGRLALLNRMKVAATPAGLPLLP